MKSKKLKTHIITEEVNENEKKSAVRLDEKRCLTVKEFQEYCSVGRNNAFKLIHQSQCGVRIGKKILADRIAFDHWLDEKRSGLEVDLIE